MYTNVTTMKRSSNDLNNKLTGRSSKKCEDTNEAHKHFFETFTSVDDNFFQKVETQ